MEKKVKRIDITYTYEIINSHIKIVYKIVALKMREQKKRDKCISEKDLYIKQNGKLK